MTALGSRQAARFVQNLLNGKRPEADCLKQRSKYKVGQNIHLDEPGSRSLSGPYLIASVPSQGKYTLSLEDGEKVQGGREFDEAMLVKVD